MNVTTRSAQDWYALAAEGSLVALAQATEGPSGTWAMEPKLDGWRMVAVVDEDGVELFARSGQQITSKLPGIVAALSALPAGTVIDGEAVALVQRPDGSFASEWGTVQSVLTKGGGHLAASRITFMAFDLIAHAGIDARPLGYAKRRALMERVFDGWDGAVCIVPSKVTNEADLADNHQAHIAAGFEGSMLKRLDSPYASGKRHWLKWKQVVTEDVVIMGFQAGKSSFAGMVGAVIFGQYRDGKLVERGKASGFDMRTRLAMTSDPGSWIGRVIEVRHMGVMPSGAWRHPQMKRQRPDKSADQCLWT